MGKLPEANREVKKKMKEAKEEWIEEQHIIIYKEVNAGSSKKAYSTLKTLTKTSQAKSSVISDAGGNLHTKNATVINRWGEYCSDLYIYPL